MVVIKHVPEDFLVTEVSVLKTKEQGPYTYFSLLKKEYTTLAALQHIARTLRLPLKALSCAGNKDKRAITEQTCSAKGVSRYRLEELAFQNMKVKVLGFGDEPVKLGDLQGNQFRIVVRDIETLPNISPRFRNLYGTQRFSSRNADIGKCLVKKEFEKAAKIVAGINPKVKEKMEKFFESNDWIGALRCLPLALLKLYLHAYQSLLWNKAAMLTEKEVLPIVGFGSQITDEVTKKIMGEEQLSPSDFVIRAFPELSVEGAERNVWMDAQDLKVGELEDDEFFAGKKKVTIEFFLPKGCYATEFIRQNFQEVLKSL